MNNIQLIDEKTKQHALNICGNKIDDFDINQRFGCMFSFQDLKEAYMNLKNTKGALIPEPEGFIYHRYSYCEFMLVMASTLKYTNATVYQKIQHSDLAKLYLFGHKHEIPVFVLVSDVIYNMAMIRDKLFYATGKSIRSVMQLKGYTYVLKTDPEDKQKCTLVYHPPLKKSFLSLPKELSSFQYTVEMKNLLNYEFVKSNVWLKYPNKMLKWHNMRSFGKIEVPAIDDLSRFDADEEGDHLQSEFPAVFKDKELELAELL